MKSQQFFYTLVSAVVLMSLLYVGKNMLIPFVLAVFIWYLINALSDVYHKIPLGKQRRLYRALCFILSIVTIFGLLSFLINLISKNIQDVVELAPVYQKNLVIVIHKIFAMLPVEEPPTIREMLGNLNVGKIFSSLAVSFTNIVKSAGIIIVYLFFLFLEQKSFRGKLFAMFTGPAQKDELFQILQKIDSDTRLYLGIKTFTSALTGILSYIIMNAVGLDFAEFWAILIFTFNYIPTIGSIVATLFPSILSLIQFDSFYPFFGVAGGLMSLQFLIGNILDPKLTGNSLNLSPVVIVLSLTLWGAIWGVVGMILCVPIMVIVMIVLSHIPRARPVAVLLSKDGNLVDRRQESSV